MARKTKVVTIDAEGRDLSKMYLITEMSAAQAEKWAFRALQALAASGVELPDNFADVPMAQLASLGVKALASIPFHVAEPLLDEMMSCVRVQLPGGQSREILTENDIEEPRTLFELRKAVMSLHLDFFTVGAGQTTG